MKFDWDDGKAARVFKDRGIDFRDVVSIFGGDRIESRSDRNGEERLLTTGELEGRLFTVVYTTRGDETWIITARRAWKNEERSYLSHYPRRGA